MMAPIGQCERCGHDIPVKLPGKPGRQRTRYCSENCRKRAWEAAQPLSACPRCGGERTRQAEHCAACGREIGRMAHDALLADVVAMYREGLTHEEMAIALGRSPTSRTHEVTEAFQLGLLGRHEHRYPGYAPGVHSFRTFRASVIEGCWGDGWSMSEIASVCGITRRSLGGVMQDLRANGFDLPRRYVMENGRRVAA